MASGETSDAEFLAFDHNWMSAALPFLCDGGVFGTFIDWRGYPTIFAAASKLALSPLNLIVWAKTNAGMGSLYCSQHELLPIFLRRAVRRMSTMSSWAKRAGGHTPLCTLTSRTSVNPLVLHLDFGHLDRDVVPRPLIIKISDHSHRNDKRPDNRCCEWFHQGILQFDLFRPLT
jgi:hypothetical protein